MNQKSKWQYVVLFVGPAMLIYILIFLLPTVILIATSFTSWNGGDLPKFIGIRNYIGLTKDDAFLVALWNTVKMGLLAAFVHVPLGALLALILYRKPRGWKLLRAVSLIPDIISSSVKAVMFVFIFNPGIGLLNGFIRIFDKSFNVNWFFNGKTAFLTVTLTWMFQFGLVLLIILGELLSLPDSYRESAQIDGATNWQIDWHINLPMLRQTIGACMILLVSGMFKYFEQIYLTTAGGPGYSTTTLALLIYQNMTNSFQYGYGNTIGVVLMFLGLISIFLIQHSPHMSSSAAD